MRKAYPMRDFKIMPTDEQKMELRPLIAMRAPRAVIERRKGDPAYISYAAIISKIKPDTRWDKIKRAIGDYIRTLVS